MHFSTLGIALLAGLIPTLGGAQSAGPTIELAPLASGVAVTGIVTGFTGGTVVAEMTINKTGPSGTIKTRQSREFPVSPNSRDVVATTQLPLGQDTQINVVLTVRANGVLIASTQTSLGREK